LGYSAYFLLSEILENAPGIKGVYIVGKAAILSGDVGDIQLPKVIFDERTDNVYFITNSFNQDFPFQAKQSEILKEEKSISVHSTFLENRDQLTSYTSAGFNVVEMESGPYLSAIAEAELKRPFPTNEILHLEQLPFDLGIINYASDNPISAQSLSQGKLALKGVEPTYLALLAVTQRIINLEEKIDDSS
jgi:hypothetical protein